MFFGYFQFWNNTINLNKTLWRVDEIVSETQIFSREPVGITGRKTWQTGRPGGIDLNQKTVTLSKTWKVCIKEALFEKKKSCKVLIREITTNRNRNKNLSTTYFVFSIFFYNSKFYYSSFLCFPLSLLKACVFRNNAIPSRYIYWRRLFDLHLFDYDFIKKQVFIFPYIPGRVQCD